MTKIFILFLALTSAGWAKADQTSVAARSPQAQLSKRPGFAGLHRSPIGIDPEADGETYRRRLSRQWSEMPATGALKPVLDLGVRNLDWLRFINSQRPQKISFSSKETMRGFPIDKPKIYNQEMVLGRYQALISQLPPAMAEVLLRGQAFTANPPIPDADYIAQGLEIDRVYQEAVRWLMMQPYLDELAAGRVEDIRGIYFAERDENFMTDVNAFLLLKSDRQAQLRSWLVGICANHLQDFSACEDEFTKSVSANHLADFYVSHADSARALYQSFFQIQATRDDVDWTSAQTDRLNFSFVDPNNAAVADFLKKNIENEWQWNGWQLLMNFKSEEQASARVEFEPGTTPHVNGVGGNVITMDANAPLTEWDVQWTIRHEFGHVIGFPDCYVEFYEPNEKYIVSYQLDIDNLMCSRRGRFGQVHFDELKRVYFH